MQLTMSVNANVQESFTPDTDIAITEASVGGNFNSVTTAAIGLDPDLDINLLVSGAFGILTGPIAIFQTGAPAALGYPVGKGQTIYFSSDTTCLMFLEYESSQLT